jgi:hypothetical protein
MNLFHKIQNISYLSDLSLWTVVFIAFGYPIQAAIPVLLQTSSTPVNIFVRLITIVILFFSLFLVAIKKIKVKFHPLIMPYTLFWVLYLLRLFYDLVVIKIDCAPCKTPFDVFAFAIGQNLLPLISIVVFSRFWTQKKVFYAIFNTIAISAFSLTILLVVFKKGNELTNFSERLFLSSTEDEQTIGISNLHLTGSYLLLMSIFSLLHFRMNFLKKYIYRFLFLPLGIYLIMLSGSRSPIFISAVILLYISITYVFSEKNSLNNKIRAAILISVITICAPFFTGIFNFEGLLIFQRTTGSLESLQEGDAADKYREQVNNVTWNQFLNYPVFGDKIVSDFDTFYPHNIYLEILISLGLVGGLIYFRIFFSTILKIIQVIGKEQKIYLQGIGIVYLYNIFDSCIGNSLWGAPAVWIIPALFIFTPSNNNI